MPCWQWLSEIIHRTRATALLASATGSLVVVPVRSHQRPHTSDRRLAACRLVGAERFRIERDLV